MRLVEHDQVVERLALVPGVGEQLQEDHEQAQRLVLLDELVPQIDDEKPAGPDEVAEPGGVVQVLPGEFEAGPRQLLSTRSHKRANASSTIAAWLGERTSGVQAGKPFASLGGGMASVCPHRAAFAGLNGGLPF
jgi:hypothetical protein